MADSENGLTKRQRQKQRRQQRRAIERAERRRARRRRGAALTLAGLVVVALIGVAVQRQVAARAERRARAETAAARLDELGCTPIQNPEDRGARHLDTQQVAAAAPDVVYPEQPPTSGPHLPIVASTGVYSSAVDPRLTTHNLEHGYVVFWHDADADDDTVGALREWAQERIEDDFPKIIVAPYFQSLDGDVSFVATAWGARQDCAEFDADVAQVFLDAHHGANGDAPEGFAPPVQPGGSAPGPDSERGLLFPPLDAPSPDASAPPTAASSPSASPVS